MKSDDPKGRAVGPPCGVISMIRVRLFCLCWVCFGLAVFTGCAEQTLRGSDPKSPEETAITEVLVRFQDALNARDAKALEQVLHDDLKAMIDRNRRIVSKSAYLEDVARRMAGRSASVFGPPKITIIGQRAGIAIVMRSGTVSTAMTFEMVREEGRWLILSWRY